MDKEKFFQSTALPVSTVEVEGWGEISIQSLTLDQRLDIPEWFDKLGNAEASYKIVAKGVVDFDDEDLPRIRVMDPEIISQIVDGILTLSHLGDEAVNEAKNV